MNVMVHYRDGALLNYTLDAFAPREGYRVTFTVTAAASNTRRSRAPTSSTKGHVSPRTSTPTAASTGSASSRVQPAYNVPVTAGEGGHGGATFSFRTNFRRRHRPTPSVAPPATSRVRLDPRRHRRNESMATVAKSPSMISSPSAREPAACRVGLKAARSATRQSLPRIFPLRLAIFRIELRDPNFMPLLPN